MTQSPSKHPNQLKLAPSFSGSSFKLKLVDFFMHRNSFLYCQLAMFFAPQNTTRQSLFDQELASSLPIQIKRYSSSKLRKDIPFITSASCGMKMLVTNSKYIPHSTISNLHLLVHLPLHLCQILILLREQCTEIIDYVNDASQIGN